MGSGVGFIFMGKMAESDSSTPSSVTDDNSVCFSSDYLPSNLSDEDGLPSLSYGGEVLLYQFKPDPSPDDSSHTCSIWSGILAP